MSFLGKLGGIARNIGDKTSDALEVNKLNGKVNAERTSIAESMRKIGEIMYARHTAGLPDDPEIAQWLAAIDGNQQGIECALEEINRIRQTNAAQAGAAQTAPDAPPSPAFAAQEVVCASCGAVSPAGRQFCGACGTRL